MSTTEPAIKDIAIDLDIGGTFTDCYVSYDGGYTIGKSSTTRYDVSVGALRAIEAAGETVGLSLEQLLDDCTSVSYSTTIAGARATCMALQYLDTGNVASLQGLHREIRK